MKKLVMILSLLLATATGCGGAAVGEEPAAATPTTDRTSGYTVTLPASLAPGAAQTPNTTPSTPPECIPQTPEPAPTTRTLVDGTTVPICSGCENCEMNWFTDSPVGNTCANCPLNLAKTSECRTPFLGNFINCCVSGTKRGKMSFHIRATWYTDNPDCTEGQGNQQSGTFHAGRNEFVTGSSSYNVCEGETTAITAAAQTKANELGFCFLNIAVNFNSWVSSCVPHDQDPRNNF